MKYYEFMELECNTPIVNQSAGADFHYAKGEKEKEKFEKMIEARGNNYQVEEVEKEVYEDGVKRVHRRNLNQIAG